MEKQIRTSRRNYAEKSENLYRLEKQREYSGRRSARYAESKNKQLNTNMLKLTVCFFAVLFTLIIANLNSNFTLSVKNDIKTALSENISSENVETAFTKLESIFTKNKENAVTSENTEYNNFRIDEEIVKQMNSVE